jgi:hypothetical protein
MDKKDATRFGSYLYRPHPWHFRKKAKSPGVRENARGERIWAQAQTIARGNGAKGMALPFEAILARVAGMAVKL